MSWDTFNQQYGAAWEDTKRRARQSRWTRKRCFWCRRRRSVTIQWHHLTYLFGVGDPPLWVLRPMCVSCHKVETWICRQVSSSQARHRWAHARVTYLGRWVIRGVPLGLVAYSLHWLGLFI